MRRIKKRKKEKKKIVGREGRVRVRATRACEIVRKAKGKKD